MKTMSISKVSISEHVNKSKRITGLGYQDAKIKRYAQGYAKSGNNSFEAKGNEEYIIYFGRAHVDDFETGVSARGKLKIGRGKYKTALQRGRNQPGIDFRIYAEIILPDNKSTHIIEKMIKETFKDKNVIGSQGQRELYDFKDEEIADLVYTIEEMVKEFTDIQIMEINLY
jgi:hypothetical protein